MSTHNNGFSNQPTRYDFYSYVYEDKLVNRTTLQEKKRFEILHTDERLLRRDANANIEKTLNAPLVVGFYAKDRDNQLQFVHEVSIVQMTDNCAVGLHKKLFRDRDPMMDCEESSLSSKLSTMGSRIRPSVLQTETIAAYEKLDAFRDYASIARKLHETDSTLFELLISELDAEWSQNMQNSSDVSKKLTLAKQIFALKKWGLSDGVIQAIIQNPKKNTELLKLGEQILKLERGSIYLENEISNESDAYRKGVLTLMLQNKQHILKAIYAGVRDLSEAGLEDLIPQLIPKVCEELQTVNKPFSVRNPYQSTGPYKETLDKIIATALNRP